ncbi:MAG: 4Fe-4S dicluster domain-containing protein [Planctomycetota bacterium]
MGKQIVVNIEKCLACKSCEIACALAHSESGELHEAITESPKPKKMVNVESAGDFGVPIQCRHCEAPPCVEICPTDAIQKLQEDGTVVVDQDLCIGCKLCMLICPFGILQIGPQGRAIIKCDMCLERLKQGKDPACVEACPTKGLKLVSIEEFVKSRRRNVSEKLKEQSASKKMGMPEE